MKELEENKLKESKSIDAKIESLLKKYGFKFWKGDPKGGSPNEDTIYDKTTEDGEWTIEYDLPIVRREDSQGIYWDSARTASYHIYFYPREDKIDKFISLFNKKYKSKFKKKDLSLEQGFDLGYGLFNNEKEFLMKLEHELKKTENRVKDIFENITTSSITGMGEVTLPTATQTGSGDVPANSGDAEEEYKKKKKKMKKLITFESFVNEAKSIKVTKKEWPYVEFKIGSKKHKVEFDYEDIIDNHGNEGQDQYWLGKDDDGKEWSIDVYADYNGDVQDVHYDTIVAESLVNEAFSRMSKDTIENELYKASQELSKYYDWLKAGNDSGKGETLNSIIDLLKKSKSNIKRFNKPEEVKGTIYESVVNEAFKFSKKEVEAAANLIASAISQADKVKAKVHDLEYDKGRGAGFEISIDGEKYDGGSYVVRDNGDVVNAAIGNSHPNAVYNTIGNKDIADVFINMEKYESLIDESVDAKDIVKTIKAVSKMHDTKFMNPFLMHEEPTHMHKELGAVKIHPGVPAYDWRRKGVIAVSTSLKGSKDWQFTGVDLKDLSELPKNFKLPKQWLSESVTELTWDSLKESLGLTEAKFNKKSLMKAMKADDGMVQLGNGKEYVIYAYDNGNDDNDDMWGDKTIFGLDQDGEEHEIEYSDIVSYNESTVNEGRSINKISKELEKTVLDMKKTVDEWKIAEGDRKSELLEKLRELNKNKVELSKELDSAVAGKDHDLQLAITEAEELAYLELDVINILND